MREEQMGGAGDQLVWRDLLDPQHRTAAREILADRRAGAAVGVVRVDPHRRRLDAHLDAVVLDERRDVLGRERDAPLPAVLVLAPDTDHGELSEAESVSRGLTATGPGFRLACGRRRPRILRPG